MLAIAELTVVIPARTPQARTMYPRTIDPIPEQKSNKLWCDHIKSKTLTILLCSSSRIVSANCMSAEQSTAGHRVVYMYIDLGRSVLQWARDSDSPMDSFFVHMSGKYHLYVNNSD